MGISENNRVTRMIKVEKSVNFSYQIISVYKKYIKQYFECINAVVITMLVLMLLNWSGVSIIIMNLYNNIINRKKSRKN